MEITLHLKNYCIEKAARKKYDQIVGELLRRESEELEKELEFILDFLKNADFSRLRKEGFDGSREMIVRVRKIEDDFVVDEI